jgi:sialate O-acetylesterase
MVRLEPLKAGGPFPMTIAGENTLELKNILVGEVWLCSGQSNMAWPIMWSANPQQVLVNSKDPMLRLFMVPRGPSEVPLHDVRSRWQECGPETLPDFSAVAYFFGRDLRKALNVPVGLINSSVGGTPAKCWASAKTLKSNPRFKSIVEAYNRQKEAYPRAMAKYQKDLKEHQKAVAKAMQEHSKTPSPPPEPEKPRIPAGLYNAMITPLQPFAIRGVTWYQGESNTEFPSVYKRLLPLMIQDWRQAWGQGDFPFLIVQLAPFRQISSRPQDSDWAELREAQLLTSLVVPKTSLIVITDAGEEKDIHPKHKEPVGARLALAARALAYNERIVYSGPVYDSMKLERHRAFLSFNHVGSGLAAKSPDGNLAPGGQLTGFTIAGKDRKFVPAQAAIEGGKVVVWSPEVRHPAAVRYGWADYPVVNLYNMEGLPASPFRTDHFPPGWWLSLDRMIRTVKLHVPFLD